MAGMLQSFIAGGEAGRAALDSRRSDQRRGRLAELASQAYGAAPDQQRGFVQQAIANDPTSGLALGESLSGGRDADMKRLAQKASFFVGSAKAGSDVSAMYPQLAQEASRLGLPVPTTYDEKVLAGLERFAQAYGGAEETTPSAIRELQMLQSNPELYKMDIARRQAGWQPKTFESADGMSVFNPQTMSASPLTYGGGTPQAPVQGENPNQEAVLVRANQMVSEGVPAEQIDAYVRQALSQPVATSGGQRVMPKERAAAASFAPLSSEEVRTLGLPEGTVAQRNTSTGAVSILNRPPQQSTTTGGANAQKLAQANATKLAQFKTAERSIERIEQAANKIADNPLFDGGPMDQFVLGKLPEGQELQQASASLLPVLTALTRVPGVGAQSDLESRLASLQMPSAEFPPEVNRRAAAALKAYMQDLRAAYENVQVPQRQAQPQQAAPAGNGAPQPGTVEAGYRFKGGNPSDPNSWERV